MNKTTQIMALCTLGVSLTACGTDTHSEYRPTDTTIEGTSGAAGLTGPQGSSCSVVTSPAGAFINCTDGTTAFVPNGVNGTNGAPGAQGSPGTNGTNGVDGQDGTDGIIAVIDPCGDAAGIYDEVLLRLSDGRILASFSANNAGDYTRFAIIPAGSYVTTDGSACSFSVSATGVVTW